MCSPPACGGPAPSPGQAGPGACRRAVLVERREDRVVEDEVAHVDGFYRPLGLLYRSLSHLAPPGPLEWLAGLGIQPRLGPIRQ